MIWRHLGTSRVEGVRRTRVLEVLIVNNSDMLLGTRGAGRWIFALMYNHIYRATESDVHFPEAREDNESGSFWQQKTLFTGSRGRLPVSFYLSVRNSLAPTESRLSSWTRSVSLPC